MIKVGLFGFGRTGKLVAAEIIKDPQCSLEWVVRNTHENEGAFASELLGIKTLQGKIVCKDTFQESPQFFDENKVDIIIDFSDRTGFYLYNKAASKLGIKVVTAISKYEKMDVIRIEELSINTAVVFSPNITVGINLILVLSELLEKIIPEADIQIIEEHFRDKPEVSGTALKIAERLGLNSETHVKSIRAGGIVGKHEVLFGLPNQTLRLIHESNSRSAFGRGAVFASKWVINKSPGLYDMESIIRAELIRNITI